MKPSQQTIGASAEAKILLNRVYQQMLFYPYRN